MCQLIFFKKILCYCQYYLRAMPSSDLKLKPQMLLKAFISFEFSQQPKAPARALGGFLSSMPSFPRNTQAGSMRWTPQGHPAAAPTLPSLAARSSVSTTTTITSGSASPPLYSFHPSALNGGVQKAATNRAASAPLHP